MNRKFLEELGLEKEVIDKIMAENGKDINAEKAKTSEKEEEIQTLKDSLEEANTTIEGYKDMKIEDIKASAEDWKEKYESMEKELQDQKNTSLLEKEIQKAGSIDSDVLLKLINHEDLVFKDGSIKGLDDQLKAIKEEKAYLFQEEGGEEKPEGDDRFSSYNPENSSSEPNPMVETIDSIFNNFN